MICYPWRPDKNFRNARWIMNNKMKASPIFLGVVLCGIGLGVAFNPVVYQTTAGRVTDFTPIRWPGSALFIAVGIAWIWSEVKKMFRDR